MGVKRCAVAGCLSTSARKEDVGVTFHQLPSNLATRTIWTTAARVQDEANIKVCSRHFREADFKLVNSKYFLIKGCYPTIFPWGIYRRETTSGKSVLIVSGVLATHIASLLAIPTTPETPVKATSKIGTPVVQDTKKLATGPVQESVKKDAFDEVKSVVSPARKSTEATTVAPTPTSTVQPVKKDADTPKKVDPIPGTEISAMDFQNVWHKAKILEVDSLEREVLIHYDDDNQQK